MSSKVEEKNLNEQTSKVNNELSVDELFKQLNVKYNDSLEKTRKIDIDIATIQNRLIKLTMVNTRNPSSESNELIQDTYLELTDAKDELIKAQVNLFSDLNILYQNTKHYYSQEITDLQKKLSANQPESGSK